MTSLDKNLLIGIIFSLVGITITAAGYGLLIYALIGNQVKSCPFLAP